MLIRAETDDNENDEIRRSLPSAERAETNNEQRYASNEQTSSEQASKRATIAVRRSPIAGRRSLVAHICIVNVCMLNIVRNVGKYVCVAQVEISTCTCMYIYYI